MQLEKGHKFNRLDSGWFWLSRYRDDRITREEAIVLFMEEYFYLNYDNMSEPLYRASGMILECFMKHYKNAHNFYSEMISLVCGECNPFCHKMPGFEKPENIDEYSTMIIDYVFSRFHTTTVRNQNDKGEWEFVLDFELSKEEVEAIVEKGIDNYLEKKKQKELKARLMPKWKESLKLKHTLDRIRDDILWYKHDIARLKEFIELSHESSIQEAEPLTGDEAEEVSEAAAKIVQLENKIKACYDKLKELGYAGE